MTLAMTFQVQTNMIGTEIIVGKGEPHLFRFSWGQRLLSTGDLDTLLLFVADHRNEA